MNWHSTLFYENIRAMKSSKKRREGEREMMNRQMYDAVCANDIEKVASLLSAGADVNAEVRPGTTPLQVAIGSDSPVWIMPMRMRDNIRRKQVDMVEFLLSAGADPFVALGDDVYEPIMYMVAEAAKGSAPAERRNTWIGG